jgi:Variant SH3 domain
MTAHAHAYNDEEPPSSPIHPPPTPEPTRPVISTRYKSSTSSSPPHASSHPRRAQTDTAAILPPRPNTTTNGTRRKVMRVDHAFDAESDSEMSIVPGELVSVIEEVDPGWFIGEIVGDEQRSGMFPSTYCTIVETANNSTMNPPSTTRRSAPPKPPISPTKSDGSGDIFGDVEEQVASLSIRKTAIRPTVLRSKSASTTTTSNLIGKKKGPPPPPPVSRGSKPTISPASTFVATDTKCRECGCQEFRANVFKKGSCNNCFHVHGPS